QVLLDERPGAGEDLVRQHLVVDLLADGDDLGDGAAAHDPQRPGADGRDPVQALPEQQVEPGVPGEEGDVPQPEEVPAVELASQVVGAGAADDGVVDVEEGRDHCAWAGRPGA